MTADRPTPEQIAGEFHYDSPLAFVRDHLPEHGYVIVHPDDVPKLDGRNFSDRSHRAGDVIHADGWNDCRRHIFGDDDAR